MVEGAYMVCEACFCSVKKGPNSQTVKWDQAKLKA